MNLSSERAFVRLARLVVVSLHDIPRGEVDTFFGKQQAKPIQKLGSPYNLIRTRMSIDGLLVFHIQ